MKIFRKRTDKELHPFIIRMLSSINQKLLRYANYLQRVTDGFSRRKRIVFLFLVCLVFVTESSLIIIRSLQKSDMISITVAPIRIIAPADNSIHPIFSESEYRRIEAFKHYLDSNKIFRDSLIASRPYLMDTLNFLQKIYKKMTMENKYVRKRKAMLILPLLVIPFLTLAFWAMGGGKGETEKQNNSSGLNMQLPNAHLKDDRDENKLSFYDQAEKDSARFRAEIKNDPLFQLPVPKDTSLLLDGNKTFDLKPNNYKDPSEEKVYAKLAELNQQLNNNVSSTKENPAQRKVISVDKDDVDRLEGLMQHVNKDSGNDPEMEQLNGMMEKILDIQHPDRVKEYIKEKSPGTPELFSVNQQPVQASLSLIDTIVKKDSSVGFYGLESEAISEKQNAIEAVVHENQVLVSGAVIKLRLLDDITINGTHIPKDNFVFGTSSLSGERLQIEIHSIRYGNSLFPVNMEVYDMDGLPGIYIPGAITRDVAKQSADNGLQTIGVTSVDPSLTGQATAAGINAAKTLLSKKAKLVRVFVKAGYKILLKDKNIQQ